MDSGLLAALGPGMTAVYSSANAAPCFCPQGKASFSVIPGRAAGASPESIFAAIAERSHQFLLAR
jgi:hypothetical protein